MAGQNLMSITNLGDYYDGNYKAGPWNYNYNTSSDHCGSCGITGVTSKCGPYCWGNIPSSNNQCSGRNGNQSPINIAHAVVNPSLRFPLFNVTNGGCSSWVSAFRCCH